MRLSAIYIFLLAVATLLQSCIKTESSSEGADRPIVTRPTLADEPTKTGLEEVIDFEAASVTGEPLYQQEFPPRIKSKRERELQQSLDNFEKNPDSLEYIIWYGRRLAYLSRYKDAVQVYSDGLQKHPESHRLLRHRGHRYITLRQFDNAISDLEKAAFFARPVEVTLEADGMPNKYNKPLTSTHFNIWYHLGLAYYLKGNYDKAISAYKKCMEVSTNDDLLVATSDWLYMTYRKIGNVEAAKALLDPIQKNMNVIENTAYHKRLLMYKGEIAPEELLDVKVTEDPDSQLALATQGYGVGFYYMMQGDMEKAKEIFTDVMSTSYWPAFGYIASEVELYNINLVSPSL